MKIITHLSLIVLLVVLQTACDQHKPKNGNAMRDRFMATLQLIGEAKEIEQAADGKEDAIESAFFRIVEKTEAAYALASTVDEGFLRWVEPGLPTAFKSLRDSSGLRAEGMRKDSLELQAKAEHLRQQWGHYWAENSSKVFKKLKVE